jgi:hypothetical protein
MVGGSAAEATSVQGLNLGVGEVAASLAADHRLRARRPLRTLCLLLEAGTAQ